MLENGVINSLDIRFCELWEFKCHIYNYCNFKYFKFDHKNFV